MITLTITSSEDDITNLKDFLQDHCSYDGIEITDLSNTDVKLVFDSEEVLTFIKEQWIDESINELTYTEEHDSIDELIKDYPIEDKRKILEEFVKPALEFTKSIKFRTVYSDSYRAGYIEALEDLINYDDYDSDIEPDDDISPYRLNIEINPAKYTGIGDDDPEERIFSELYSVMCDDCKKDLLNDLKLTIYKWKTRKEINLEDTIPEKVYR